MLNWLTKPLPFLVTIALFDFDLLAPTEMNYANDYAYSKETQKKLLTTPKKLKRSYCPFQRNSKEVIGHSKESYCSLQKNSKEVIAHSKETQKSSCLLLSPIPHICHFFYTDKIFGK